MNLEKLDAVRETPAFALLKKRLCELRAGEVADIGPVAALRRARGRSCREAGLGDRSLGPAPLSTRMADWSR